MEYLTETYDRLYFAFLFGWAFYAVSFLAVVAWLMQLKKEDHYRAGKRYYGIITMIVLFIVGVIGSIFLPSPELFAKLVA